MDGVWMPLPTNPQQYCEPVSLVFVMNSLRREKPKEKKVSQSKLEKNGVKMSFEESCRVSAVGQRNEMKIGSEYT